MRKSVKIASIIAGICILSLTAVKPVLAESTLNASLDKESCENGESVKLTVEAVTDGDFAVPPQISVEYNPNRLQFDDCSCEYGGGGGGLVTISDTSAQIGFTALSGGNADINLSAIFSDDSGEVVNTTVTLSVNGDDTAAGTDDMVVTNTGVSAGTIDTGDGRMVQTVFADEFMPSLFHKETCDYQGQTIECAKFDMGDITILYTTDAMGNDGKFMIYNAATSDMNDFRMIQGIENRFIIVLSDCEGEIPNGYTKAVLDWNGQTLTAFMNPDAANSSAQTFGNLPANEFFLVYAISSEGNKGWYQYDQNEGTYQRYFSLVSESGSGESVEDEDEPGSGSGLFLDEYLSRKAQEIMLIVFVALTIILLIVVIILAVKCSGNYEYYEDDYYGDEGDEEDVDEKSYSGNSKRGGESAASYVSRQMAEDDEEGEEDEEDEDDVPVLSKRELKEAKREEKWRRKEEKKAEKLRARGYEEATPMDWSSFNKDDSADDEDRKRYGKSRPPRYMQDQYESEDEDEEEIEEEMLPEDEDTENEEEDIPPYVEERRNDDLPPRKRVESENETIERKTISREEEQRERQKRLFEQQQRIEEQQQIEQSKLQKQQEEEQQKFIASQHMDEELDEDFQFEFLNF